jgi:hypothetical protein
MLKLDADTKDIPVLTYTTEYEGQTSTRHLTTRRRRRRHDAARAALRMN